MTEVVRMRKLSWEYVSAISHPEHYRGGNPCVAAGDVPEAHWSPVERAGDDVASQHNGPIQLMGQGELIRNVRIFEGEATEPQWVEVNR